MSHQLRYLFDPGSGVCLWAGNDAARERHGYAINHWDLPLTQNTKRWLQHLIAWFDTSLDWDRPAGTDARWTEDQLRRFQDAARRGIELLRQELPAAQYELIDETSTGARS